jgi:hypothetical protein
MTGYSVGSSASDVGTATCGGASVRVVTAPGTYAVVAPGANSGGGGSAVDPISDVPSTAPEQAGADGIVVIRFVSAAVAPKPAKPTDVRWSGRTPYSRVVVQPRQPLIATFAAEDATTYAITATWLSPARSGATASGTCRVRAGKASCSIRLARPGRWRVSITPTKGGVTGPAARRIVIVRATEPAPVTG